MARRVSTIQSSSPVPESDCVEGFAHPRDCVRMFGHEGACAELAQAFLGGKIHHGWLLSGPSGIGKATLAYRFAKFVLAEESERVSGAGPLQIDEECATARLVRAQAHPGLLVIRRPYDVKSKRFVATIPVDEVRRVRNFLTHSGGDLGWRVVIIDTADEMNVNAANAVLKSLEEPPARTIFLLLTSEPGRLLPTIRSRCRVLAMALLEDEDLRAASESAFGASESELPVAEEWDKLLELGRGRVGRVLSLFSMGGSEVYSDAAGLLAKSARPDWAAIHRVGDKLAPASAIPRFELFFDLLLEQVWRLIRAKAGGDGGSREVALASELINDSRLSLWASGWEEIARGKTDVAALNLDRKAFVIETAQRLHELAAPKR